MKNRPKMTYLNICVQFFDSGCSKWPAFSFVARFGWYLGTHKGFFENFNFLVISAFSNANNGWKWQKWPNCDLWNAENCRKIKIFKKSTMGIARYYPYLTTKLNLGHLDILLVRSLHNAIFWLKFWLFFHWVGYCSTQLWVVTLCGIHAVK